MNDIEKRLIEMSRTYVNEDDGEFKTDYFLNIQPILNIRDYPEEVPTMTLELWIDEWNYHFGNTLENGIIDTLELDVLITGEEVLLYNTDDINILNTCYHNKLDTKFTPIINKWKEFIEENKLTNINLCANTLRDVIVCD